MRGESERVKEGRGGKGRERERGEEIMIENEILTGKAIVIPD